MIVNSKNIVFSAFKQFFKLFGIEFSRVEELTQGSILGEFLLKVQGLNIDVHKIINDFQVYGAAFSNLKYIMKQITQFQKNILKNDKYDVNFDFYEICHQLKQQTIEKLLIQVLRVAIQGPNSQLFVRKVMQLSEIHQNIFISMIKTFIQNISPMQSPHQVKQIDEIISDKIQVLQYQNQSLQNEIKLLIEENKEINQHRYKIQAEVEILQQRNFSLTNLIIDLQQKINNMSEDQNQQSYEEAEKKNQIINNLRQQNYNILEFHKSQQKQLIEAYQNKIQQCNEIISIKNQDIISLKNKLADYLEEAGIYTTKCLEFQIQKKKLKETIKYQEYSINQLQQRIKNLSLQLELKNIQTEEIQNIFQIGQNQKFMIQNKQLARQMMSINEKQYALSDDIYRKMNFYKEEIIRLKSVIDMHNSQINQMNKSKLMAKEIESQNKKLRKILYEYQNYRGEENQIILGCLYQLRTHCQNHNNIQNVKLGLRQRNLPNKNIQ